MMVPVDISITIDMKTSDLEGPPGSTVEAHFQVENRGDDDHFTFSCVDEMGFVRMVFPKE